MKLPFVSHGESSVCRWRNGLQYGGQLRIYRTSSRGQLTRGGSPAWGLGEALTTPHPKNWSYYERDTCVLDLSDPLERPKKWKRDVRFGTWNERNLCRSESFTSAARKSARYKTRFFRKWDGGGAWTGLIWFRIGTGGGHS